MFLYILLVAPAAAIWCSCNHNDAGSFAPLLGLSVDPIVRIGSSLVDSNAVIFRQATDPQALVSHLSRVYADGQAVAASQLLSRCMRFSRGGFDVMVTSGFMIAARNQSRLTWLRLTIDLFAACRSTTDVGVFRTTQNDIKILPVDLRELDSNVDPTGSLIDGSTSVCMPRVSDPESDTQLWLGRTYNTADIQSGLVWWLQHRTYSDILVRMQLCGPHPSDVIEGAFFARNSSRPYVQVCTFQDAVWCAADTMLMNQKAPAQIDTLDGLRGPGLLADNVTVYTRVIHYNRPAFSANEVVYFSVLDIIAAGSSRQVATVLFTSLDQSVMSVYAGIDIDAEELQVTVSSGEQSVDCDRQSDVTSHHFCDPLVFGDAAVSFVDTPPDVPLSLGVSGGLPCTPAITSVCPAVKLPSPVFHGSTISGIVIGSLTWTLIGAWVVATIIGCSTSRRQKTQIGQGKKNTTDSGLPLARTPHQTTSEKRKAASHAEGLSRRAAPATAPAVASGNSSSIKKEPSKDKKPVSPSKLASLKQQLLSDLGVTIRKL